MREALERVNNKWVRLLILIIVFANTVSMMFGHQLIPFTNEEIATFLSVGALAISEILNHWKNNSYTKSAKEADTYLKQLKL